MSRPVVDERAVEPHTPSRLDGDADPVLDELGRILLDLLRLDNVNGAATAHVIDAIRLRALEAGWFDQRPVRNDQALQPWQEELAVRLLLSPASAPATIGTVASACGISTAQFSRAFKNHFGVPPLSWRLSARVERAKVMMLETALSLTDIALECGFTEQSHFNHIFLKRVGTSPSVWRRQHSVCAPQPDAKDAHV
ncbi:AraC-like DNA-binding protein [Luteibacter sp. HA06]